MSVDNMDMLMDLFAYQPNSSPACLHPFMSESYQKLIIRELEDQLNIAMRRYVQAIGGRGEFGKAVGNCRGRTWNKTHGKSRQGVEL